MAQQSKYSDTQVNQLIYEIITVFEKNKTPVDLSLITLGNMVSQLINNNIDMAQRQAIAQAFANSLLNSVTTK